MKKRGKITDLKLIGNLIINFKDHLKKIMICNANELKTGKITKFQGRPRNVKRDLF